MSHVSQQLASGALSGLATTVILQPFDLLKTRMQQGGLPVPKHGRPHASMVLAISREIVRTQGLRGLWRGTEASLYRNVPGVAMYMASLTQLRGFLATSPHFTFVQTKKTSRNANGSRSVLPTLTSSGNLAAGAAARVTIGFLLNPFSVLKARFESNMYNYQSVGQGMGMMVRSGPSELFRGFLASAMRDAPHAGIFIVFYEQIKKDASYLFAPQTTAQSSAVHAFSAASAGALATITTQPFDVIKTRIQVRPEGEYHSILRTVKLVLRERGPLGLFDGASLRMSRKVLSSAIGWVVYEAVLMVWTSS
ncbi:hypothetical protein D9611_006587 [Ephemerocybe angulata]|uniref:Mitochondrial glycine transporter n=1 Tax=Ephemerocybe angulata TaxID=980116 RepID=A0A8H5FH84_9AGAR|nr:hypothetical protein D9611_006587 [Tulosesus angulatus]